MMLIRPFSPKACPIVFDCSAVRKKENCRRHMFLEGSLVGKQCFSAVGKEFCSFVERSFSTTQMAEF